MKNARLSHVIFCAIAAIVFALAAFDAQDFEGTSRYFPQFAAVAGLLLALLATVLGVVSIVRRRRSENPVPVIARASDGGEANPALAASSSGGATGMAATAADQDRQVTLVGLGWLGIWIGFTFSVMILGYILGSGLWLAIWFRTVHKWRLAVVIPVVAVSVLALWAAQTYANVHLPGGNGLLFSLFR